MTGLEDSTPNLNDQPIIFHVWLKRIRFFSTFMEDSAQKSI